MCHGIQEWPRAVVLPGAKRELVCARYTKKRFSLALFPFFFFFFSLFQIFWWDCTIGKNIVGNICKDKEYIRKLKLMYLGFWPFFSAVLIALIKPDFFFVLLLLSSSSSSLSLSLSLLVYCEQVKSKKYRRVSGCIALGSAVCGLESTWPLPDKSVLSWEHGLPLWYVRSRHSRCYWWLSRKWL